MLAREEERKKLSREEKQTLEEGVKSTKSGEKDKAMRTGKKYSEIFV